MTEYLIWAGFIGFVVGMVLLDLGVFHKKAHIIKPKEAITWTCVWVALALLFNVLIYFIYEYNWGGWSAIPSHQLTGQKAALQFFTGYIVEKSLSLDNIFVIAMIFGYFKIPSAQQHRLLFWGVMGALVFRGIMIAIGSVLIGHVDWIVYVFGAILILSASKMLVMRHDNLNPKGNLIVRFVEKYYPVAQNYDDGRFFATLDGKRAVTPLFLALILVETSDIMFAVDSIPAIFAITKDPFLVFTSNVFAMLGLRALYFLLAGFMDKFRYLKMSLVFLLAYVGIKMILSHHFPIPNWVSLVIIFGILSVGILASVWSSKDTASLISPLADELEDIAIIGYRQARKVLILVVGLTILLIGVVMIVLPGPAILVIPLGLGVLAIEFHWARIWLAKVRKATDQVIDKTRKAFKKD